MSVRNKFSERVRVVPERGAVSLTKQSMSAECDVNNIMKKFIRTGAVSHMNRYGGRYADVSPLTFHEAMNVVREGEELFDALPARLRRRFRNSPEEFLAYVQNPANVAEMVELGLATAKPELEAPQAPSSGVQGAEPPGAGDRPA